MKKIKRLSFILLFIFACYNSFGLTGYTSSHPKLAYWEIGKGKHTVVVLHGGPSIEHQYMRPEFDGMSKMARVIYYDQRGCGRSALSDSYKWKDHVEDLRKLIDNLAPNQKVFLVGSSWGSILALLSTQKYPNEIVGLILSGLFKWPGKGMDAEEYKEYSTNRLRHVKDTVTYKNF